MEFFDSHCHLAAPAFEHDLHEVLNQAHLAQVSRMAVIADSIPEARQILEQFSSVEGTVGTAGVHPHFADAESAHVIPELEKLFEHPYFRAVGEIGLDAVRSKTSREDQVTLFIAQVRFAKERNLPMVLHCREAFEDLFRILADVNYSNGILHCFTGGVEEVRNAIDLNLACSFSAIVTYPKNDALRKALHLVPQQSLLIETDAPYLPPHTLRGQRNEPALLIHTAQAIAEELQLPLEDIARITTENAKRIYRI